ncbi:unnamed protein product [Onchocerca flexuosa]|uniref:PAZ domain-containing protein n=1 Tax=Onchocerca flexuosa TaxID=387005 RepID=A0A183I603_9BILA|nr:unnamed protein product [Onchocerca flexuosa]
MSTNVSSCIPLFNIVKRTRAALCQAFIDPFCSLNQVLEWCLGINGYHIVNEPTNTDGQEASGTLVTDFYDVRSKQQKLTYPNTYTMYFGYPPPYLRTRS